MLAQPQVMGRAMYVRLLRPSELALWMRQWVQQRCRAVCAPTAQHPQSLYCARLSVTAPFGGSGIPTQYLPAQPAAHASVVCCCKGWPQAPNPLESEVPKALVPDLGPQVLPGSRTLEEYGGCGGTDSVGGSVYFLVSNLVGDYAGDCGVLSVT